MLDNRTFGSIEVAFCVKTDRNPFVRVVSACIRLSPGFSESPPVVLRDLSWCEERNWVDGRGGGDEKAIQLTNAKILSVEEVVRASLESATYIDASSKYLIPS